MLSTSPPSSSPSNDQGEEKGSRRSPRQYTFTPQRVKSLPRAWERRPATPYVPRNEAQKIWKRVPLGVVSSNVGDKWRKETQNLNTRPVKRLRVSQKHQEEDKENTEYIGSKWDENETVATSPKRKAIGVCGPINQELETGEELNTPIQRSSDDEGEEGLIDWQNSGPSSIARLAFHVSDGPSDPGALETEAAASPAVLDSVCCLHDGDDDTQTSSAAPEPVDISSYSNLGEPELSRSYKEEKSGRQQSSPPKEQCEVLYLSPANPIAGSSTDLGNLHTGHDDTAYLHDFLSRARAQKAAKQQPLQETSASAVVTMDVTDESAERLTSSHVEDVETESALDTDIEDDATKLLLNEEVDVNLSPLRRSSRLTTRLPRLQKPTTPLPSSISLKRLTGTEFITTQREIQSLAVTTRANTKRNKADSVAVNIRLMQLNAEAKARKSEGKALGEESRKRKKGMKEVTWDEMLARHQDGSAVPDNPDEDEIASMEGKENLKTSTVEEHRENDDTTLDPIEAKKSKQMKPVRRMRKLNAGTVNGTPTPKRTMGIRLPVGSTSSSERMAEIAVKTKSDDIGPDKHADGKGSRVEKKPITRRTKRGI